MDISTDRAYVVLRYYCDRKLRLRVGGHIAGEGAACEAVVTSVDEKLHRITLELLGQDGRGHGQSAISLKGAAFSHRLLGDGSGSYEGWVAQSCHSVLVAKFGDSKYLLFAEPMG